MKQGFVKANRIESGNYPKSSFIGTLKDICFSEKNVGETDIVVLRLDFEDGKTYNIKAVHESEKSQDGIYGIHQNGDYDEFMAIGQWLKSVEVLDAVTGLPNPNVNAKHISIGFGFMDNILVGIDFDPEIRGCMLHNVATLKTVGSPDQTSKYPDWTISQIEGLNTTAPTAQAQTQPEKSTAKKPGKFPSRTQAKELDTTADDISDIVLNVLDSKILKSIKTVFVDLGKKYDPKDLRVAFSTLEQDGFIVREGDKYRKI